MGDMPTPEKRYGRKHHGRNIVMGVADDRYGCCRQSIWAVQSNVMGGHMARLL